MIDWKNVPEIFKPCHMRKGESKAMKQIKTNNAEHTATPWEYRIVYSYGEPEGYVISKGDGGENLVDVLTGGTISIEIAHANAEFITRACHAHDELVEAVKRLSKWVGKGIADNVFNGVNDNQLIQLAADAKQALAKAEGAKKRNRHGATKKTRI